jgi:hypothetical protein
MKSKRNGLIILASAGALLLATSGPALAATGAETGWEYAAGGGNGCGMGLPQSGFELPSDQFVLTDTAGSVLTIDIGPSVAAPQGAAPGTCTTVGSDPVVPANVPITGVKAGSTSCTGVAGDFLRVNSTVTFHFTTSAACGGATTWDIRGDMQICYIPVGPFTSAPSPACAQDPGFPTAIVASAHLVTTYVNS